MLALGRNPNDPNQKLSPGFEGNVNKALVARQPPVQPIAWRQPPWDDWHLIKEERNPFAHLGAGGGRFPPKADAGLAVEEAEKAIGRIFGLLGITKPRWLISSDLWPKNESSSMARGFGFRGGFGGSVSAQLQSAGASPSDPKTIRVAITELDGTEKVSYYLTPNEDWRGRFDWLLDHLSTPIKGARVYDGNQTYIDEPLLMWGGEG